MTTQDDKLAAAIEEWMPGTISELRAILARHGLAVVPVEVLAPIERLPAELPQGMVELVGWAAAAHDARTALAAATEARDGE